MTTGTPSERNPARPPAEAAAWKGVGTGWRPLFGRYTDLGFSFEWHDFEVRQPIDWGRSFHPGSLEVCLNLDGVGEVSTTTHTQVVGPRSVVFYRQGPHPLAASRRACVRHRFITVEFATPFLASHLGSDPANLHPLVADALRLPDSPSAVSAVEPMTTVLFPLIESLRHCPVFEPARVTWFRCKALEVATLLFFRPSEGELFCTRAQRSARERVQRARTILSERLANPPSLEELARTLGCSPFYLSRQFSAEAGVSLQQYIRRLRLERAADLLRSGRCNVTEAALEVGYNSLSHFSTAFHAMFGCCPGLYPRRFIRQEPVHPHDPAEPPAGPSNGGRQTPGDAGIRR